MRRQQGIAGIALLALVIQALVVGVPVRAQDDSRCRAIYEAATIDYMAHCFHQPAGVACTASGDARIHMASGQVVEGPGRAAQLSGVAALRLAQGDGSAWSVGSIVLPDLLDSRRAATLIALGPATLTFEPAPDLPPGAAFTLEALLEPYPCADLARPGVLVQSPPNSLALLRVNGIDVAVNGTAWLHPSGADGLVIHALTRETILSQSGTVIFAGTSVTVAEDGAVSGVEPYDMEAVAHLPTEILPVIDVVALPGNAMVLVPVNLHLRPAFETYTNTVVNAGVPVTVFGRNGDGQWLYVRAYDGEMGWVPAGVLDVRVPVEMPVLDETPPVPLRPFGSVQGIIRTREESNTLRAGPGQFYDVVTTVPVWTDLALYGRSRDDQWLYVEAPDGQRGWINVALISATTPYALEQLPYPPEADQ